VDGQLYETQSSQAPFNAPFFLIMNLAVGGNYVGNPSTNAINTGTTFPAEIQVDYVRVYEQTAPLALSMAAQPNGSLILTWPTNIVCHMQIQTNSLAGTNWFDMGGTTNPFVVSPNPNNTSVFYRLESP
jgi:beta-glucanase (GH16 family)